jgi:hypothetical protein
MKYEDFEGLDGKTVPELAEHVFQKYLQPFYEEANMVFARHGDLRPVFLKFAPKNHGVEVNYDGEHNLVSICDNNLGLQIEAINCDTGADYFSRSFSITFYSSMTANRTFLVGPVNHGSRVKQTLFRVPDNFILPQVIAKKLLSHEDYAKFCTRLFDLSNSFFSM